MLNDPGEVASHPLVGDRGRSQAVRALADNRRVIYRERSWNRGVLAYDVAAGVVAGAVIWTSTAGAVLPHPPERVTKLPAVFSAAPKAVSAGTAIVTVQVPLGQMELTGGTIG